MQLKFNLNQSPPSASEQFLRDLVFDVNGFHLPKDAVFGTPTHYTPLPADPNQSDTQVVVSMQQSRCSGDTGQRTLFYRRLFLSQLTPVSSAAIVLPPQNFSLSQILPQINATYGISLDITDIVDRQCTPQDGSFVLQANPNSLAWQDQIALPIEFDLSQLQATSLAGFDEAVV